MMLPCPHSHPVHPWRRIPVPSHTWSKCIALPMGILGQPLYPSRKSKRYSISCSPKAIFPNAGSRGLPVPDAVTVCPGGAHLADRTHLTHPSTQLTPRFCSAILLTLLDPSLMPRAQIMCGKISDHLLCRLLIPEARAPQEQSVRVTKWVVPSAGTSLIPWWSNMEQPTQFAVCLTASRWPQPFLHPRKQDVVTLR